MRIFVINGSPHKGNTWKIVECMLDAMRAVDEDIEIDELHLMDFDLPYCRGCSLCFREGHNRCPHYPAVQDVMDRIEQSDGVVFAASTFQMHVPALTKNLTDHLSFLLHRPRYLTKKALVVATTGGVGARGAVNFLAGTLRGWGFNRCHTMAIATRSWNDFELTERQARKARQEAQLFLLDIDSRKLFPPKLMTLLPYSLFRGMYRVGSKAPQYPTRDHEFWNDPDIAKHVYFKQVPIGLVKRFIGSVLCGIGGLAGSRMQVTYRQTESGKDI